MKYLGPIPEPRSQAIDGTKDVIPLYDVETSIRSPKIKQEHA